MSKIQWTNETWNPIVGCSKISEGCVNCYAESLAKAPRLQKFEQYQKVSDWDGTVEFVESQLYKPLSWKTPKKIFVCSMGDLFHEDVNFEWIDKIMAIMCHCKHHTFQVLTKRPDRAVFYFNDHLPNIGLRWFALGENVAVTFKSQTPLPNIWIGVSVENQARANERIPLLYQIPAKVKFLSCEPLLEPLELLSSIPVEIDELIDNEQQIYLNDFVDWVIVGGESGSKARPCYYDWILRVVQDCKALTIPVFVKQLGSNFIHPNESFKHKTKFKHSKKGDIEEFPDPLKVRQFPQFLI